VFCKQLSEQVVTGQIISCITLVFSVSMFDLILIVIRSMAISIRYWLNYTKGQINVRVSRVRVSNRVKFRDYTWFTILHYH